MSGEYHFTQDWFHWSPDVWLQLVPKLPGRERFIEIGSFEGRSAVWTVEHMLKDGGTLTCVDTWSGGEEHQLTGVNMDGVEEQFDANIAKLKESFPKRLVNKIRSNSYEAIGKLIADGEEPFDFVFIDGSHKSRDVITDACMLWPKVKTGGMLVFDDYLWGHPRDILHRPKIAVDAFTAMFGEELGIVHLGYQLIVQKG